jgi:hypothetical protein
MRAATGTHAGHGTTTAIAVLLVLTAGSLAAVIPALREPAVLMALTYGTPAILVFVLLGRIWRKGPDAADGPRNRAVGAETATEDCP